MNKKRLNKAFTLVEILVVLTIIAILLGIVMISLGNARRDARDTKRKADLEIIRSGLELYKSDCGSYPDTGTITAGAPLVGDGSSTGCVPGNTYISSVPTDPIDIQYYDYVRGSTDYLYDLCALLEGDSNGLTGNCKNCSDDGAGTVAACNHGVRQP